MAQPRRAYWSTKGEGSARCRGCRWTNATPSAQGSAARHHDQTGHVVEVKVARTIVYGEDRPGAARWWRRS